MQYGVRELAYFLSRFPGARHLGDWTYSPTRDGWVNAKTGSFLKIGMEAHESVATCLYLGLSQRQISAFIENNGVEK